MRLYIDELSFDNWLPDTSIANKTPSALLHVLKGRKLNPDLKNLTLDLTEDGMVSNFNGFFSPPKV